MNKVDNIENQIVMLLSKSLCQGLEKEDSSTHPSIIFEASKSIIGLNIDNPCHKLINYMIDSSRGFRNEINCSKEIVESETTSIFELKECLESKNYDDSKTIISRLVNLSDGKNLIEFMLENSMLQTGKSLQLVWSIYKIMSFIGYNNKINVRNALALSSMAIIFDDFQFKTKDYGIDKDEIFNRFELDQNELYILSQLYEIERAQFIREKSVHVNAIKFLYYFKERIYKETASIEKTDQSLEPLQRKELLKILLERGISENNILLINSIRAYMKNCKNINYARVFYYLNQFNGYHYE